MGCAAALGTTLPATLDVPARLVEQPAVEGNAAALHCCLALEPAQLHAATEVCACLALDVAVAGAR